VGDSDVEANKLYQSANVRLNLSFVFTNGMTTHFSETGPGLVRPLRRTVSIDQIVVLERTLELILDSGEKRVLNRGNMVVQRGTMHTWRNPSETGWVRFFAVVQLIKKVEIDGKKLGNKAGGMLDL